VESDIIAGVFGRLFNLFAEEPEENRVISYEVWKMTKDYNFDYFLMGCDDALIKLGIGERDIDGLMNYKE